MHSIGKYFTTNQHLDKFTACKTEKPRAVADERDDESDRPNGGRTLRKRAFRPQGTKK